jgi:hypothetical protein
LGWIAATPNGRIYLSFFFGSPEKSPKMVVGSGIYSPEVAVADGGWQHLVC